MIISACKNRFLRCFALSTVVIPTCLASGHAYLGSTLGASFAETGKAVPSVSYFSGTTITDAYPLHDTGATAAVLSLNGGYEWSAVDRMPAIALGLGLYSTLDHYNYKGLVIETAEGDASFPLYNYRYHTNSARLMAELQLSWAFTQFSPFINAGIGAAWNRMSGYSESAVTSMGYPPLPAFQSHTDRNLAWQIGLGASHDFQFPQSKSDFPSERISLGYRYVDLGTASFGGRNAAYPYALNTGTLTSNDVYIAYTHLF